LINDSRNTIIANYISEAAGSLQLQWRAVNNMLHPITVTEPNTADWVQPMDSHFQNKVATLQDQIQISALSCTATVHMPLSVVVSERTYKLEVVTAAEVARVIGSMNAKSSYVDFLPTNLLKEAADVIAPAIAELTNLSFTTGMFPSEYKFARITPILKKPNLPREKVDSFRPVAGLVNISKIMERLFLTRLQRHLAIAPTNVDEYQSAYTSGRSCETALRRVQEDLLAIVDSGSPALLISLDVSAAFDSIDHEILLDRLQLDIGVTGVVLAWLRSFLTDRTQYVGMGGIKSSMSSCGCGVPQGSILEPVLFSLFLSPISRVIAPFRLEHHVYSDDLNIISSFVPSDDSQYNIESVISCIHDWYVVNGLLLNEKKTEVLLAGTSPQIRMRYEQ